MTRRPIRSVAPRAVALQLRDGREWAPSPPPEGWTPASALAAAARFSGDDRRLAAEAHRALLSATPGLRRADAEARLRGRDSLDDPPF